MQNNPPSKEQIEAMEKEFMKKFSPRPNPPDIKLAEYNHCFICNKIVSYKKEMTVQINGKDVIAHRSCVEHVCRFQSKFPDKFIVFKNEKEIV